MKLSKEQIENIKKLSSEGKKQTEIAKLVGCSQSAIVYWLQEDSKRKDLIQKQVDYFRSLPVEKKKEIYKKRGKYIKDYLRNKYQTNEVFRKKELARGKVKHEKVIT